MTHMKRHRLPTGERAITPMIAGMFPHGQPFFPMMNNCQADFITDTSVFEIEPAPRWQSGLAQALEYWTLTLQSLHPVLILLDDGSSLSKRALRRATTTLDPLPLQLWIYSTTRDRWDTGGPAHHYRDAPTHPPITPRGEIWRAPPYLLKAFEIAKLPYAEWLSRYQWRTRQAPTAF